MDARETAENYAAKGKATRTTPDTVDLVTNPVKLAGDGALPYRAFCARHPEYDIERWRCLRALYKGGKELLNRRMLARVLARNNREPDEVYDFRCAQAFYLNYCSEILDHLVANLAGDAAVILKDGKPLDENDPIIAWSKDVSPPRSESVTTLDQHVQDFVLEALQVRSAWVLLDKPPPDLGEADDQVVDPADAGPRSMAEAEELGVNRACVRVIKAEDVYHWECDPVSGRVLWALVGRCDITFADFYSPPMVRETFTRYSEQTFSQWSIVYPADKPPQPDDPVGQVAKDAEHGFERMPLRRFHLPAGLWAMDKLESAARAVFNKWCALDIAERRALLPILYEFMGAEQGAGRTPVAVAQQDPDRAVRTPRSPHHVQRRGKDDRAEFVGPSSEPFKAALASVDKLVQEMHRVLYQMALASDPKSSAAIGRSGASKAQDRAATVGVLEALGKRIRPFVRGLLPDVLHAAGKPDAAKLAEAYSVDGFEKFDDVIESDLVDETATLLAMNIQSPTAVREIIMRLLRRLLDHLNDDQLEDISEELETNINAESMINNPNAQGAIIDGIQQAVADHMAGAGGDVGDPADGGEGGADGGDEEGDASKPKAAPAKKPRPAGALVDTERRGRRGAKR